MKHKVRRPPLLNRTKRYERRGECRQCGWCCQQQECEHLSFVEGKAVCAIHPVVTGEADAREPSCGWWPQAPPILHPRCGYYFVDTWENNRAVGFLQV